MIRVTRYQVKEFNGLSMLAEVKSSGQSKPVFFHIFKDGENWVSSDSRRLALFTCDSAEMSGLDDGFYDVVVKSGKEIIINYVGTEIGQFPDYRKVIPTKFSDSWVFEKFNGKDREIAGIKTGVILYRCHAALNVNYITPILKYFPDGFNLKRNDHLSPVVFEGKGNGIVYVVMTIQVKADED